MTEQELLTGFEPMTEARMPEGMEPMWTGKTLGGRALEPGALKYTVRVSDGEKGARFIYLNRVAMAELDDPEFVVPYFERERQLLVMEVSDGKDPHALKLVKSSGGRGRIGAEYYDELAQIFESAIPEWKRKCGKTLVFYQGTKMTSRKAIVWWEHGLSTPEHIERAKKEE